MRLLGGHIRRARVASSRVFMTVAVVLGFALAVSPTSFATTKVRCDESRAPYPPRGGANMPQRLAEWSQRLALSAVPSKMPSELIIREALPSTNNLNRSKNYQVSLGPKATVYNTEQMTKADEVIREPANKPALSPQEMQRVRSSETATCDSRVAGFRLAYINFSWERATRTPPSRDEFLSWYMTATEEQRREVAPVYDALETAVAACFDNQIPPELGDHAVRRAVGVLVDEDTPFCTGLRIDINHVVTAKHCFYRNGVGRPDDHTLDAAEGRRQFWFIYEAEPDTFYELCAQTLPTNEISTLVAPRDNFTVRIAAPRTPPPSLTYVDSGDFTGRSLYVRGFNAVAFNRHVSTYLSASAHGGCHVESTTRGGCILHGCQSLEGMSGAPMFLRDDARARDPNQLSVIGINLGEARGNDSVACGGFSFTVGSGNIGARFQHQ